MPTTIVTGASRGIGATICEYLIARGHFVIGLARQPGESFKGEFHSVDLYNEKQTEEVMADILARHQIDGLVNNAGKANRRYLEDITVADMRDMFALNVESMVKCTQAVIPQMKERRGGRIVNMASRAMRGREKTSAYAATKAAVEGLTRSWAIELGEFNIAVNAVAPGIIESEMFRTNNPADDPATIKLLDRIPMHRAGEAREVAAAVNYFLSEDAAYTTGQTLFVCGGWSV